MYTNIPELEPFCNSWIITRKDTGEAVFETFSRRIAEAVNQDKYRVETSYQYLVNLNKKIKQQTGGQTV